MRITTLSLTTGTSRSADSSGPDGTIGIHNRLSLVIDDVSLHAGQQEAGFASGSRVQRTGSQIRAGVLFGLQQESAEKFGTPHACELAVTALNTLIEFGHVADGAGHVSAFRVAVPACGRLAVPADGCRRRRRLAEFELVLPIGEIDVVIINFEITCQADTRIRIRRRAAAGLSVTPALGHVTPPIVFLSIGDRIGDVGANDAPVRHFGDNDATGIADQ